MKFTSQVTRMFLALPSNKVSKVLSPNTTLPLLCSCPRPLSLSWVGSCPGPWTPWAGQCPPLPQVTPFQGMTFGLELYSSIVSPQIAAKHGVQY